MVPVPAEIDLFTIPHSRMKELVNTYSEKVQCVDYRNCQETHLLLKELHSTLYELKSHETIENMFIMDQLKNRLKQRHIYNSAVCNCHSDNRLMEMWKLVKRGRNLKKRNVGERIQYGKQLQKCFLEFVKDFLPHMEEEENIFQPLMVEHFDYEELRVLKDAVLEQHELLKDPLYREKAADESPEFDCNIKDFRDLDASFWCLADLFPESDAPKVLEDSLLASDVEKSRDLPNEVLMKIFSYLLPPDRGRCAQVCWRWNDVVYSQPLWKVVYPVQWARGIWQWDDVHLNYEAENEALQRLPEGPRAGWKQRDEDADVDEASEGADEFGSRQESCPVSAKEAKFFSEILQYLLPRIGRFVETLVLDSGRGLTSYQIRQALILCQNVHFLSASYTTIDYHTFKGLKEWNGLRKLRYLDVQGCEAFDDNCLTLISRCLCPDKIFPEIFDTGPGFFPSAVSIQRNKFALLPSYCPYRENLTNNEPRPIACDTENWLCCKSLPEIEDICPLLTISPRKTGMLHHLNLSGCHRISETGLYSLLTFGLLRNLQYLNLSSCFNVSGAALSYVIKDCVNLAPENLFYCNGIINGPYPSEANGCDNICHPLKICCQSN